MDIRDMMERTQAINMFWEREIDKYLKLKPTAMIAKDEIVGLQEGLAATGRGGASQLDVNDLWKSWTDGYKELVNLASDTTKDNSRNELLQIYGVTVPLRKDKSE